MRLWGYAYTCSLMKHFILKCCSRVYKLKCARLHAHDENELTLPTLIVHKFVHLFISCQYCPLVLMWGGTSSVHQHCTLFLTSTGCQVLMMTTHVLEDQIATLCIQWLWPANRIMKFKSMQLTQTKSIATYIQTTLRVLMTLNN